MKNRNEKYRLEKQAMKSFEVKFPLSDRETIEGIFKFVRNHLKVRDFRFEFIEQQLLMVTRKENLQMVIKDLFFRLKPQRIEGRVHAQGQKVDAKSKLSKRQIRTILNNKARDLIKSSGHRSRVESPKQKLIREFEADRLRNEKRNQGISIYVPNYFKEERDLAGWRLESATPTRMNSL